MSADCGSDTGLCAHCGSFSDSLCDGAYNSIKSVVAKDERNRIADALVVWAGKVEPDVEATLMEVAERLRKGEV